MARCEVCGNDYDKSFQITAAGTTHTFDSFECAIHRMAPTCEHCGCKVVGHGMEAGGRSIGGPTRPGVSFKISYHWSLALAWWLYILHTTSRPSRAT